MRPSYNEAETVYWYRRWAHTNTISSSNEQIMLTLQNFKLRTKTGSLPHICIHKAALIKTLPWTFHIRKALWHDCLGFWYNYMKEPLICYSVCVVILWPWNKHIETATVIGTLDNESFCAEYHAAGKDCVQNGYFFLTSINLVHCRLLHYTVFPKS